MLNLIKHKSTSMPFQITIKILIGMPTQIRINKSLPLSKSIVVTSSELGKWR